jgi:hypothetical protein
LLSKSRVNVATASLILPPSSSKVVANGGMYTASLMYPPKIQKGVRSGERGGQVTGLPLSIHFFGNLLFKKSVTSLWKCGELVGTACHREPLFP